MIIRYALAALLIAAPVAVEAQTATRSAPATTASPPASSLTRSLNGAPPATVTPNSTPVPATVPPVTTAPTPATRPATAAVTAPQTTPPASTPAPVPEPTPELAAPPPVETVLSPAQVASLPFTVTLPVGFVITAGRPGPGFQEYAISRADQSFARIYVGPSSQFPIYSGEVVQTAGRASVVTTEGTTRHAIEHLFQRPTAPREIHIWTSSLDGADRVLAERIAGSLDVK